MGGASCVGWIRVDFGGAGVEFYPLFVIMFIYTTHTRTEILNVCYYRDNSSVCHYRV